MVGVGKGKMLFPFCLLLLREEKSFFIFLSYFLSQNTHKPQHLLSSLSFLDFKKRKKNTISALLFFTFFYHTMVNKIYHQGFLFFKDMKIRIQGKTLIKTVKENKNPTDLFIYKSIQILMTINHYFFIMPLLVCKHDGVRPPIPEYNIPFLPPQGQGIIKSTVNLQSIPPQANCASVILPQGR